MGATLTRWRLVLHRTRADLPVLAATWLLLLCAITLVATGVTYGDAVSVGGLRQALAAAPIPARTVLVQTSVGPDALDTVAATIDDALVSALGAPGGEVAMVVWSDTLGPSDLGPEDADHLTRLASYAHLDGHAALLAGRWATAGADPVEATLSEGAARSLGLGIGDRVALTSREDPSRALAVTVTGLWQPDPADPFWRDDPLELLGREVTGRFTERGPFVVARADLLAHAVTSEVAAEWRVQPSIDRIGVSDLDPIAAAVSGLGPDLGAALPGTVSATVTTDMPQQLAKISRSVLARRSGVLLLTIEFAVLAGYAVLMVAGMLADRRRAEVALLRSRGASTRDLAGVGLMESVVLTVPAVLVAPWLAIAVVGLFGAVGPLAASGVIGHGASVIGAVSMAILAGVACVVLLTLPEVLVAASTSTARAVLGRPSGRTIAQRLGVDLALLALAAIALWQLRLYGAPLTADARGSLGLDPLLVAAPAIGLLAGAVMTIRFLPRLAEAVSPIVERRPGLAPATGARQLARRPLRATRSGLLLVLAAALGTFAVVFGATWGRSQVDQAAYQAVADVRVHVSDYPVLPAWAIGPAYRALDGVTAAIPAGVRSMDVGRVIQGGQLLAVDPVAVRAIPALRADGVSAEGSRVGPLLDTLAAARPAVPGVTLPGTPRRIAVTLDAALTAFGDPSVPAPGRISVAFLLQGPDGLERIDGEGGSVTGLDQRLTGALTRSPDALDLVAGGPLRLAGIELTVTTDSGVALLGHFTVSGVWSSQDPTGDAWDPVAMDPATLGWTWTRTSEGAVAPVAVPDGAPFTISIAETPDGGDPIFTGTGAPPPLFRLSGLGAPPTALAAIASDRFLEVTGARVGDTVAITTPGIALNVHLIGSAGLFPPLDPANPFLVVDGPTLAVDAFGTAAHILSPNEWWLSVTPERVDAVIGTLHRAPWSAGSVVGRADLERGLSADPVALGVIGALALGALAALLIASVGFVLSATVSAGERLGEFALLRALGLSVRSLSRLIHTEHLLLLLMGSAAGVALGLLLAWLVVPFSTLTASGTAPVPAPVVEVPWTLLVVGNGLVIAVLTVLAGLATRRIPRAAVSAVLRTWDN